MRLYVDGVGASRYLMGDGVHLLKDIPSPVQLILLLHMLLPGIRVVLGRDELLQLGILLGGPDDVPDVALPVLAPRRRLLAFPCASPDVNGCLLLALDAHLGQVSGLHDLLLQLCRKLLQALDAHPCHPVARAVLEVQVLARVLGEVDHAEGDLPGLSAINGPLPHGIHHLLIGDGHRIDTHELHAQQAEEGPGGPDLGARGFELLQGVDGRVSRDHTFSCS